MSIIGTRMHSSRMHTAHLHVVLGGGGRGGRCSDLVLGGWVDVQTLSRRGGGRCSDLVLGGVDVQTLSWGGVDVQTLSQGGRG